MKEATTWWWMVQGKDRCPFCLQIYLHEEEYRCTVCDNAFCQFCTEISGKSSVCPDCLHQEEED